MEEHINLGVQAPIYCFDGSAPRAGFEPKIEHGPDAGDTRPLRRRRAGRQGGGPFYQFIQIKTKLA
jgi:hypothetical protein